ncbi:hypothetical protein [Spirillospora sp. CA-128828]|uniref:hypothetical protein n=1 Tax=Spirillospora sp. CA-128828 TaxID=3240033 RepID=UPI003D8DCB94
MTEPSTVFAYACAVPAPGAAPVDEILVAETGGHDEFSVVWVRHPGSFTGTTRHVNGGAGDYGPSLLLCWADMVFELADQVEHRPQPCPFQAAPAPADPDLDSAARAQAAYLRWTAAYALNLLFRHAAGDIFHDEYGREHGIEPKDDLGELTADQLARIARQCAVTGPAALIPPGWDLVGWDHYRTRPQPILAGLRPPNGRADETDPSK